jgi:hypothetical protein
MPRSGPFTSGKDLIPTVQEAQWATGRGWTDADNVATLAFEPLTVQPLASRNTDCAMPSTAGHWLQQN